MSMNKEELLRMMESLAAEELKLVSDYVEQATEDKSLDMKAFNNLIDNSGEITKELIEG